jgi:hypothetical protein
MAHRKDYDKDREFVDDRDVVDDTDTTEVRGDRKDNNWLAFLLIPLAAFLLGAGIDRALNANNRNQASNTEYNQGLQQGVGGSGVVPCMTPGASSTQY